MRFIMRISSTQDAPKSLIIEPWGEVYEMVPHAMYTLSFRSPVPSIFPHEIEVEYALDAITVYACTGCVFTLWHQGEIISPGEAFAGPRVPEGIEILKQTGFFTQTIHDALASKPSDDIS
jgi:hypothetical protein